MPLPWPDVEGILNRRVTCGVESLCLICVMSACGRRIWLGVMKKGVGGLGGITESKQGDSQHCRWCLNKLFTHTFRLCYLCYSYYRNWLILPVGRAHLTFSLVFFSLNTVINNREWKQCDTKCHFAHGVHCFKALDMGTCAQKHIYLQISTVKEIRHRRTWGPSCILGRALDYVIILLDGKHIDH